MFWYENVVIITQIFLLIVYILGKSKHVIENGTLISMLGINIMHCSKSAYT